MANEFVVKNGAITPNLQLTGSTSGSITVLATANAGTNTLTLPAVTGTAVTTGDTGSVTNTMLAGSIANTKLTNSSITVNGSSISLGGSATITASNPNALTIGTGLSGTSYIGSAAVTIAIDSTVALRADVHYIGTTSVALNRTSANLALTGISSITLPGSTSGTVQLVPTAAVGTGTILTIPATTGTIVTTGDTGTVTNTMLAGSIANAKLSNSTISGISLGSNLNTLTIGTGLSGTSYNGSTGVTIAIDSTVATLTGIQTLTNKTLTSPAVTTSLTTGSTTFNLLNTTATTINIGGASTAISIGNTAHTGTTSIQHDLYVYGNITFGGGSTQLSATQLVVDDPLIYIGDNNVADITDLGVVGAYNNGTHLHTGLVRDASDSVWKLFSGMTGEPTGSTLDFTGVTYAPLQVGSLTSTIATGTAPLTVTSTTLVSNLNSDYLDGQHGSYYTTAGNLTGTISSTVLGNSTHYIGTTAVTLNRASANLALTGISSVTLPGSTSGTVQLVPIAAVGTGTVLTIPAVTGTIVTTGDTGTVTNTMLAGSIAITKLAASTISGISLGNNLNALTISTGLSGTSYNGTAGVTIAIDSTVATLTGIQTLTNKTLTNPTINGFTGNTSIVNIGSGQLYKDASGNVGIGTSSPGAILHTSKTSVAAATVGAFIQNSDNTVGTEVRLGFAANTNLPSQERYGWIGYVNTGGTNGGALTFATTIGGTPATERMRIDSSGNVGIGNTPSGTYKLEVSGNISSTTLTSTVATGTAPFVVTSTTPVANLSIGGNAATVTNGVYTTTAQTLTNKSLSDSTTFFIDETDATKKLQFQLSSITTATTRTLTVPDINGTIITTGDTGTITSTMIADGTIVNGDISASAAIAITKLASSTISGVSLGSNLNALTISAPLTGTSYNGSSAVSIGIPAATTSVSGYLTSTDWNTFNGKYSTGGALGTPSSGTLTNCTFPTLNQSTTGNAATATTATYHSSPDGDRLSSTKLPTTSPRLVRFDFVGGAQVGSPGSNYAGLMTYAPWTGDTASTGDASYQLAFASSGTNGTGVPVLKIRKGIDSTWNAWYDIVTSASGTATTATNVAGGVAGSVHYQTATGTTAMTAASTAAGQVLTTTTLGGAPTWVSPVAAGSSGLFNPNMSASVGYLVTTSSAAAFTAPATAGLRYIVHSIHVTNIGTVAANLTSNITGTTYSGGIDLSCTLPIPIGGAVELLKKPKVMQPSDILNMISSVASTLHATIAYEISSSTTYFGVGVNVTTDATYTDLYTMTGNSVLESIFLVNDSIDSDAKVTLVWTDGANTILGYFAYNFIVALNSTVELLEKPKYMASGYKLRIQSNVGNRVEAIVAGKTL